MQLKSTPQTEPNPFAELWAGACKSQYLPCMSDNRVQEYIDAHESLWSGETTGTDIRKWLWVHRVLTQHGFSPLTPRLWVFQSRHSRVSLYVTLSADNLVWAAYARKEKIISGSYQVPDPQDYRLFNKTFTNLKTTARVFGRGA